MLKARNPSDKKLLVSEKRLLRSCKRRCLRNWIGNILAAENSPGSTSDISLHVSGSGMTQQLGKDGGRREKKVKRYSLFLQTYEASFIKGRR